MSLRILIIIPFGFTFDMFQLHHDPSVVKEIGILISNTPSNMNSWSWISFQEYISHFYLKSSQWSYSINPLISIDVVLQGLCGYDPQLEFIEMTDVYFVDEMNDFNVKNANVHSLCLTEFPFEFQMNRNQPKDTCDYVAVGGTFDYLHIGHKILLSVSAWITKTKLTVGVMGIFILIL